MRNSDRGSVTIWVLGLSVLLLLFGGLALDYWRALALQRQLASIADSAAIAAASGIDEAFYRSTGVVQLDPDWSEDLALQAVTWHEVSVESAIVDTNPNSVTVTLTANVELGLLGVFVDQTLPLVVRATATAVPELVP